MLKLAQHPLFLTRVKPHKTVTTSRLKDSATAGRRIAFHAVDRPQQQAVKSRANCLTSDTFSFFPVHRRPQRARLQTKDCAKTCIIRDFRAAVSQQRSLLFHGNEGIFESGHRNRQTGWARGNRPSYGIREKALRDLGPGPLHGDCPSTRPDFN